MQYSTGSCYRWNSNQRAIFANEKAHNYTQLTNLQKKWVEP